MNLGVSANVPSIVRLQRNQRRLDSSTGERSKKREAGKREKRDDSNVNTDLSTKSQDAVYALRFETFFPGKERSMKGAAELCPMEK